MNLSQTKHYLLNKPEAKEDFPFGPEVSVFKVSGKMYATLALDNGEGRMNLKCDPNEALMLRDIFPAVIPGYHMNKKHWNTIKLDGTIPEKEIERMIDHSYALVVKGMTKAQRNALELHYSKEELYK